MTDQPFKTILDEPRSCEVQLNGETVGRIAYVGPGLVAAIRTGPDGETETLAFDSDSVDYRFFAPVVAPGDLCPICLSGEMIYESGYPGNREQPPEPEWFGCGACEFVPEFDRADLTSIHDDYDESGDPDTNPYAT